ncbi:MAG: DegV family EDD domain-containing protein [Lachnospiraceae bacterium]|nr:DegV family EDD domain-containing protein [Lachnospiraceae bacterium]
MNPVKLIQSAIDVIKDPNRDFTERIYLILSLVSEITATVALIGDLFIHENPQEIIVIVLSLIFVPAVALIGLYFDNLKLAIRLTVIGIVFGVLPGLFFFGGGVKGGGVIWIIFGFMYVGLVLRGAWRNVMFSLIAILSLGCYVINYYYPWWVYRHSTSKHYIDSFISLILVGVLSFVMTWSQGRLFRDENERAKKAAEKAEELTRSQNRFFSSMSHEIRTPINSILGLNELILRDQNATDDIIKDATGIQGSGKMLLALINDILDFSKIEAGSMDIVPVDYRVGDLLSEIVNMMWLRATDKGLGFEVTVDPDVPVVLYGDEVRIKQIIINLLNNAVKYTEKGKVGLRVESRDLDDDRVELMISVSDTGMGIKKEDLPYLFNAFKRVDEGKNRHIEGTGLGLSIVKQLIELMDGEVTVNSIYGEGSTFTVLIKQVVSDHSKIGELNIHNQQMGKRSNYESSFLAPEARILIVDDNEMNLEVEGRLLEDTDMSIDKALSGREALEMSQKVHYDAIFMDHLMPEMDGIECLKNLRNQEGGLNRNTPVIILTANAGSENRELYNMAGFDGYLVKPVSGEAMEDMLIRHISSEKVILRNVMLGDDQNIHADKYAEKLPVIITSSGMCDLPDSVVRKLHIPIIPFTITTDEGEFKDGINLDANELIRHMGAGKDAVSSPPDEAAYTEFFAENLKRAHHLIHIAITSSMSKDYTTASEVAKSFDNVSVINSGAISSATGILVLIACKLAQQGMQVEDIVSELEMVKRRLKCSFVIDRTEYMARRGLVSRRFNRITDILNIHPALRIKDDKVGLGGMWLGRTKRAYRRYISKALPPDSIPDPEVVFITYVDLPTETLNWIEDEIKKLAYFEHVIFKQASAAISSNCGPGTFGILYFLKSNRTYNISSFIDDVVRDHEMPDNDDGHEEAVGETDILEETVYEEEDQDNAVPVEESLPDNGDASGDQWYNNLKCINTEAAIKNSGSAEAFKTVLEIFYNSIGDKHAELMNSFSSEDWETYTIKIHALKSSARLVGALDLGSKAELLEKAGKEKDIDYIRENHSAAMADYLSFKDTLAPVFSEDAASEEQVEEAKPEADSFIMESVFAELLDAAEQKDRGRIEGIIDEMSAYAIPASDRDKYNSVLEKTASMDYGGIIAVLADKPEKEQEEEGAISDDAVRENLGKILRGEINYTSSNFAFNILLAKLRKAVKANPGSLDSCLKEIDGFFAKYPIVAKADLANIAAL